MVIVSFANYSCRIIRIFLLVINKKPQYYFSAEPRLSFCDMPLYDYILKQKNYYDLRRNKLKMSVLPYPVYFVRQGRISGGGERGAITGGCTDGLLRSSLLFSWRT
ncbi:hypothetical protein A7K99_18110 [Tatumella citrea]|uniref:Uncharacterized protein n=1 Tax=Tatumella citrea TaxID=53336 RepID=A0A1Y0LP63_TATCI|nr:hypothetical protein A7K98_18125 [Tatumella citrea]ARU99530.1 hypothetical protein A7K99_18110 [Tatumella citrea]